MKPSILALCAMWRPLSPAAQTNPPPVSLSVPPPTTTNVAALLPEPTSTTSPDNTRYLDKPSILAGCEKQLAAFNNKPCDIIFIGDSITEGWLGAGKAVWDKNYAPRHALDFGVSGDATQSVSWRVNNMTVQRLKPKVAVVLIGTNNFQNTPHEIADGIKRGLANTQ